MKAISKLHYITTSATMAEQACAGGVKWIQLRLKNVAYDDYKTIALHVQEVCKRYNATFIINDNVRLALDIGSDGVHVGKEDPLPQEYIDELLARDAIIGRTTNTIEDILHFKDKPVSYLGLGPYRFTTTKQNLSPILGIEGYREIFNALKKSDMYPIPPIIGIGGVTIDDVQPMLATGLHGLAISGAISNAPDISKTAAHFINVINN